VSFILFSLRQVIRKLSKYDFFLTSLYILQNQNLKNPNFGTFSVKSIICFFFLVILYLSIKRINLLVEFKTYNWIVDCRKVTTQWTEIFWDTQKNCFFGTCVSRNFNQKIKYIHVETLSFSVVFQNICFNRLRISDFSSHNHKMLENMTCILSAISNSILNRISWPWRWLKGITNSYPFNIQNFYK
jgi:hypothetical protein